MRYSKISVTENQISDIIELVIDKNAIIGFDVNDVKSVVVSEGNVILFEAIQDIGETVQECIRRFFDEAIKETKETILNALLSIQYSEDNCITAEHMHSIREYMDKAFPDSIQLKWGQKELQEKNSPMKFVLLAATRPIT